jgi:hypothetical protein
MSGQGHPVSRIAGAILVLVLFAPLAAKTLPVMVAKTRQAVALAPLAPAERRAAVLGPWTHSIDAIAARLSTRARVDLVFADERGRELAPFVAAALYPRPVWCYDGWEGWRTRTPASFIRDARAVNAASPPPPASDAVVLIDPQRDPPLQLIGR